ncbi:hypothetical protein [Salipiger sp. PrR007]|uniref:hypothetical protein n=1 Tax=Salipiger sp. PrR007 TaxID=2706884 RepID=UPI0013BD47E7|nr:hypothetical protein [Salipiger sp. PrR007]NDW34623.1 hypothetical protein [Salipiger sp. PrR007]
MSVLATKSPGMGQMSKPGRLVKHNQWFQFNALPLSTGEIPAFVTKISAGASVHSRTSFTLRHFLASVESAHPPIVEISVENYLRKLEPQLVACAATMRPMKFRAELSPAHLHAPSST